MLNGPKLEKLLESYEQMAQEGNFDTIPEEIEVANGKLFIITLRDVPEIKNSNHQAYLESAAEKLFNIIKFACNGNEVECNKIINNVLQTKEGLRDLYYLGLKEQPALQNDYLNVIEKLLAKRGGVGLNINKISSLIMNRNHEEILRELNDLVSSYDEQKQLRLCS